MNANDFIEAIKAEEPADTDTIQATVTELAGEEPSMGHVQKITKNLVEDDSQPIDREKDGYGYVYYYDESVATAQEPADGTARENAAAGDTDKMPVVRGYDFSMRTVDRPDEFISSNGELERLSALVEHRHSTERPVRALISGHSGTGKTTLCENVAAQEDAAWFEVQMDDNTTAADLFGSPMVVAENQTQWVDSEVTKALMASAPVETQVERGWAADEEAAHEGPAFLLIDELNRARPKVKNALFGVLDHRARAILDGPRGGEVIQGDGLELIVAATLNEGREYLGNHRTGHAEDTRWTGFFETDYLAKFDRETGTYEGVDTEAELISRRSGIPPQVARMMCEVAAEVRSKAADDTHPQVNVGIPTRTMLAWADNAQSFDEAGIDNPIVEAARNTVLGLYRGHEAQDGRVEVESMIEDRLHDAPLDGEEFEDAMADEIARCMDCSWSKPKPAAEQEGVMATMKCPECNGDIDTVKR